jgi:hypothetical protein
MVEPPSSGAVGTHDDVRRFDVAMHNGRHAPVQILEHIEEAEEDVNDDVGIEWALRRDHLLERVAFDELHHEERCGLSFPRCADQVEHLGYALMPE